MIRVGDIELANNVAAAPMSGVSDLPFRVAAMSAGAGLVVSEMVASAELSQKRPDMVRRAEGGGAVAPFVIQLAGCDPAWMAEGARHAEAAGADIIDINMGCPSRQVTGVLSGSALMKTPDLALRLIEATVKATSRPVTLKMRLGWDRDCLNAPEIAAKAEHIGVRMITVHGRTRNQFYKGSADWREVAATRAATRLPLLVNGDIVDAATAQTALAQSGADGVMIGRAAIGRPWLPGAIARALASGAAQETEPALSICIEMLAQQYDATLRHYGRATGMKIARKHLAAFADWLEPDSADNSGSLRAALCRTDQPDEVFARLNLLAREAA